VPEKAARHPSRLEPASRNSLSLPQDDRLFPDCHSGIEVSGLPLRCLAEPSTEPFGSRLLRSPRLAPVWARSAPQARSLYPAQQPNLSSDLHSPLGPFGPLQIKAFNPIHGQEAHLPKDARLPIAPRRRFYWNSDSVGSTFQARFASGRLTVPRTSWNQVTSCLRQPVTVK
jgi:hypothetical protein